MARQFASQQKLPNNDLSFEDRFSLLIDVNSRNVDIPDYEKPLFRTMGSQHSGLWEASYMNNDSGLWEAS